MPRCCACSRARSSSSATEVAAFEREFAAYCGASEAIGVNTGTSALHLALLAAGVGAGRRGDHRAVHLRRDGRGDRLRRRDAGVRRRRSRTPARWTRRRSSGRSRRAPRPSCRCTSTASRPTWIRSWRSPRAHGLVGDRGRRPGARRRVQGPAVRHRWATSAASASTRARTSAPTARAARSSTNDPALAADDAAAARLGRGDAATSTRSRASTTGWTASRARSCGVKLRHLEALDRGAPRARGRLPPAARRAAGVEPPQERPDCAPRLPRLRRAHCGDARRCTRDCCRPRAFRPASTIRFRCTCSRPMRDLGYRAGDFPGVRAVAARSAVAADVPGADAGADRDRCRRRSGPRRQTPAVS